ncbi:DUF305 domain-containing protein [Actinosynnema sp. NPDC047251]|uniref:DUF305 domain-containing protein n=1 Tax=Saccharothrix espanaensis (strain ATCC 51144 / DSM 44229 / JCM 9112 / NBRC 15066 / NRRL 15764) TaxID=1179773 RepID=K0K8C9_SACES|nr:DUF305 domain-containing protein [Saccharothrix espanaensis]CCH34606.1 hypothetical protein BN6_73760 [Saccharothrix espanaensis DSM 44229]
MTSEDTAPQQRGSTTATRAVVVTVAVVAVLLLGAAVGLLIQLPGSDSAGAPGRDSVDIGFTQDMAVHHLQGITMANTARDKTANPAIRQLAFDIESTQLEQVGRMKGWLSLWGAPEQSSDGTHMKWMESSSHDHTGSSSAGQTGLMPGMATSEELARLRSLSGTEFDVYFLQLMLRHHQGGAPMAQYAATHAGVPVVRTLADNMLKSQSSESEYMKQLIAERGAAPLP